MTARSVHARVLGPAFDGLHPLLRAVHDGRLRKEFSGRCSVQCGRNRLARLVALFASLPRRSQEDIGVHVLIERRDGSDESEVRETWTRRFGTHRMHSAIWPGQGALEERFGPVVLIFGLTAEPERITWRLKGARLLFVPLPRALFADCSAFETIMDGKYCFDARAGIAGIGLLVHYKGWLADSGQISG